MNKHEILYLVAVGSIALLILSASLLPLWTDDAAENALQNKAAPASTGKARRVDYLKVQALIHAGELSDHEALWWEAVEE